MARARRKLDTHNVPMQCMEVTPDKKFVRALHSGTSPADLDPAKAIRTLPQHQPLGGRLLRRGFPFEKFKGHGPDAVRVGSASPAS